jgi:hypothetical protein
MSDTKLPLIHKAPVEGILVHVARARLSIGDPAAIDRLPDGRIGVYATVRKPILGFIPRRKMVLIGHLGPSLDPILAPSLAHGDALRIRIIDLTPEHLANGNPPEIYISVWGDPRHLNPVFGMPDAFLPPKEDPLPRGLSRIHPA